MASLHEWLHALKRLSLRLGALPLHRHRYPLVIFSLLLATIIAAGLVVMRSVRTFDLTFAGLVWNLFLAWIPLLFALAARRRRGLALIALGAGWLLFFPNAPYIMTDVIHFRPRASVPYWYDLILILWFAWTGFMLGYVSLYLMHKRISELYGRVSGWLFSLCAIALGSFGVYLGRFQRWNSWDILIQPTGLMTDIYTQLRHPLSNLRTYGVTLLFAVFLFSTYLMLFSLSQLPKEGSD